MSTLPSPTEVSGKHNGIYEAYYKQVDSKGIGKIDSMTAAKFLKKSGLSDVVLSRIWDLSDPKARGYLDKNGFFVALKLVALAQHGHDIHMRNIFMEPPTPPKVGDIPKLIKQKIQSVPASNTDWTMNPSDKLKYEELFESLGPINGLIEGNKVRGVLMESKLPLETLGRIWDLADQDKDGRLDKREFTIAMHLVYLALDKRVVPTALPPELQKIPNMTANTTTKTLPKAPSGEGFSDGGFVAEFPKDIAPPVQPPAIPLSLASVRMSRPPQPSFGTNINLLPGLTSPVLPSAPIKPINSATLDWVVTAQDRIRFENIFRDCDKDKDGLVSGIEVKNVFLNSGVPQNCLAHIWALCDTNESGKLTLEQFALAMWMVEQKLKGFEPPEVLAPNMIPPSLRSSTTGTDVSLMQTEAPQPRFTNPELEMIAKEIDELAKESSIIEADIAQKEADVRIKTGEIRSLQSELDTLAATLKQLDNQKREAQKRLDDLTNQIRKIREQCQKQEEIINEQEGELNLKRSELQKLRDEEAACEKELNLLNQEINDITKQLQDKQLERRQVKAMITELLENQRQMNDTILLSKAAIETKDSYLVSDYSLKIEPNLHEAKSVLQKLNKPNQQQEQQQQYPTTDPFNENTSTNDGFGETDAFASNGFTSDPFAATTKTINKTGFDDSFMNASLGGFDDAFGSSFPTTNQTRDPFMSSNADPFGDKKISNATNESGKDDFGSDPFAILHAPTSGGQILSPNPQKSGPPPRPESPSPALPPKKSKQPPPRPAPPRPLQGPTRPAPPQTTTTDAFGSSTGGFADFADFDDKRIKLLRPVSFRSFSSSPSLTSPIFKTTTSTAAATVASSSSSSSLAAAAAAGATTNIKNNHQQTLPPTTSSPIKLSTTLLNKITTTSAKNTNYKISSSCKMPITQYPRISWQGPKTAAEASSIINFPHSNPRLYPTDFVDDPFKDYRYEDPFNIHDPFDDNAGDGYHGNDNKENKPNFNNNGRPEAIDQAILDKYEEDFKIIDGLKPPARKIGNPLTADDDLSFDNKKTSKVHHSNKSDFNFDDFEFACDFSKMSYDESSDEFDKPAQKNTSSSTIATTTKTTTTTANTVNENFASFDVFENVKDIQNFYLNKNNNNTTTNNNNNTNTNKNKNNKNNNKQKNEKIADKYVNDYSVSDTFNDDLEAAIQRSIIEQ